MHAPRIPLLFALSLLSSLVACGDDGSSATTASTEGGAAQSGCDGVTNVSDGPMADAVSAGAAVLVCYYPQPSEGYCRKITDPAKVASYFDGGNDKGAIGCADAVILGDAECPTLNAVGRCVDNSIDAERVYYACSKFADPEAHCGDIAGTYTAL